MMGLLLLLLFCGCRASLHHLSSPELRQTFLSSVLTGITRHREFAPHIAVGNITLDVDALTSLQFYDVHVRGTDSADPRVVGQYEVVTNDVQQAFPRTGELNVTLRELVGRTSPQVTAPVTEAGNHSVNLDYLVDFILRIVRDKLRQSGRDQIPLPNVDQHFSTDIVFIPVSGQFRAQGGWFRNLSTVHRTSDTLATMEGRSLVVTCSFGLQTMQFGFKNYEADLGDVKVGGELNGNIGDNSIAARISLTYMDEKCKATLDSLKMTRLNKINVQLTGWGAFSWLITFIANCETGSYRSQIMSSVERQLAAVIQKDLSRFQCDQYFRQVLNRV